MKIDLKYVTRDRDRHGNIRLYYRRNGRKQRLRGPEGSPEFLEDYRLACVGQLEKPKPKELPSNSKPKTFRDLVELYYQSSDFMSLSPRTRRVRRQILDRFCAYKNQGDHPFSIIEPRHLMMRRDAMRDRPEAANGMLKAVRQVFNFAVEYQYHDRNPARLVKNLKSDSQGHVAWTSDDIDAFINVHPHGTTAYLAVMLALYTGQRKSDLILLGPQHIVEKDGMPGLEFTQQKNIRRRPVKLWIPIADELADALTLSQTGESSFILNAHGRPFTEGAFGNRFRKWCNKAGLTGLSVHGLRKTAAAALAEVGCTEQEIMSITGHSTSEEVIRYTKSASQTYRAKNAIHKLSRRHAE